MVFKSIFVYERKASAKTPIVRKGPRIAYDAFAWKGDPKAQDVARRAYAGRGALDGGSILGIRPKQSATDGAKMAADPRREKSGTPAVSRSKP